MTVVVDSRDDFTLENYRRVAVGGEPIAIGPQARRTMAEGRADFLRLLESDRTQFIYGVTSSFGPRAKLTIPPDQQRAHARAFGFRRGNWARGFGGGYLDERVVRGIVFARLANFVAGNSKARPVVAERLAALLDGPLPRVPLDGEVGAGEVLPMAHVMQGLQRDDLEEGEANPLMNGSPVSAALAADTALQAGHRLDHAEQIFALSVEAFGAPLDAYDDVLDDLWGDEDDASALAALRRYLAGAAPGGRRPAAVPTSYLVLGRVLGQAHRAVAGVDEAARVSLRSVTDNPVYVPPDEGHPLGRAFSTGGFHNAMAYPALNALAAAWADLTLLVQRHVTALGTAAAPAPPVRGAGSAAGAATSLEPVLGGLVEEARAAAMPTLLPAAVNDAQDDVSSPTFSAYRRQARAAECLDGALAVLAAAASQALLQAGRQPAPPLQDLLAAVRAIFPPAGGSPRGPGVRGGDLAAALARSAVTGSAPFGTGPFGTGR
ncbi:MAG TPA: aromatic amino acid lyase [Streptosporangiaceae bacterium]|nr:aromatic amino acid lyase [Streptosporangiaceae bacterium]